MTVIVLLLIIAVVVALPLVLIARRRPAGGGSSTPAEFLVYLIMLVATLLATNAFSGLVELLIPGGNTIVRRPDQLALSLATLLVSGIVAVALWFTLERQHVTGQRPARALYTSGVIGFSMGVVAVGLVRLGLALIGVDDFAPAALADLASFGAIWFLHEKVRQRGAELDELRSLAGTVIGLALTTGGFGLVLHASLSAALDAGQVIVGPQSGWDGVLTGLVLLVVGVPYLWWFWFRDLILEKTGWRDGYATIVTMASWLTTLAALGGLAYTLFSRIFGLDEGGSFGRALPAQISTVVTGGLVYWHHRGVVGNTRTPLVRIIDYSFSSVGFVVGAGGLVTLLATVLVDWFDPALVGSSEEAILGSTIALALGGLALWRYWLPSQRLATDPTEAGSPARKVALIGLLTGSSLVGLGGLIAILFVLLRSALGGSGRLSEVLNWAVPLTLVAGGLAWYFARIRPRRTEAVGEVAVSGAALKLSTVTVVASDPGPLPQMIEGMRFLRRNDGIGTVDPERAAAIVSALGSLDSRAALVTVDADSFEVIPLT